MQAIQLNTELQAVDDEAVVYLTPMKGHLVAIESIRAAKVGKVAVIRGHGSSREKLSQENEELNLTIQRLLSCPAGHRSERHADPAQHQFPFSDDPIEQGVADAAEEQAFQAA